MKFSVCIPTLNRAGYIAECIESILAQNRDDVEIVVLDGGSTDSTLEILRAYEQKGSLSVHSVHGAGIDADILDVGSRATGDYIWFMSDDDALLPGALNMVAAKLEAAGWPAGASLNYVSLDKTLTYPVARVPATVRNCRRGDFLYRSARQCFAELGIHLGYLSAQIVRRSLWTQASESEAVKRSVGSSWIIAAVAGSAMLLEPRWLYIHDACFKNRTANDSFQARLGVVRRHTITHSNFPAVAETLFGPGDVPRAIRLGLIYDRMPRTLAALKANGATIRLQRDLLNLYLPLYGKFPSFWLRVFPLFLIPGFAFRALRAAYLNFAKYRGTPNQRPEDQALLAKP